MRLHNFCIDQRLGDSCLDLDEVVDGCVEVAPNVWRKLPKFDNEGRPVEHLTRAGPPPSHAAPGEDASSIASKSKSPVQDNLIAIIEASPRCQAIAAKRKKNLRFI
jgi:hypothetical protein